MDIVFLFKFAIQDIRKNFTTLIMLDKIQKTIPFKLARPFTLGVPFVWYQLTLSHRLLTNLYAVSKFLLRAIASGAQKQTLVEVTALSGETIDEQLSYLCHQGYLDDSFDLTEQGKKMVEIEKILPGIKAHLGIDEFAGSNIIFAPRDIDEEIILTNPSSGLDASLPKNTKITQFDQQQALSKVLTRDNGRGLFKLLSQLYPEYAEILLSQQYHLDYSVEKLEAQKIKLKIDPEEMTPAEEKFKLHQIGIIMPILEIQRSYQIHNDIPWHPCLPESDTFHIELFSNTMCSDFLFFDQVNNEERVLPKRDFEGIPALSPVALPLGVTVNYRIVNRYANFLLNSSLMTHLVAQYPYLNLAEKCNE
jgi:hypothetical protein